MANDTPVKPGWKTSEFYVTIATAVSGILMAMGYVDQEHATALVTAATQLSGGAIAMAAVVAYIWGRAKTKSK
mgnify:CR=1 FL=1